MASYSTRFRGSSKHFYTYLEEAILNGSHTSSLEEKQILTINDVNCCIQIFERYSWFGGNRVSMNVTILEHDGEISLLAVTAGGSQAMFWKVNTVGEESFLEKLKIAIENYHE